MTCQVLVSNNSGSSIDIYAPTPQSTSPGWPDIETKQWDRVWLNQQIGSGGLSKVISLSNKQAIMFSVDTMTYTRGWGLFGKCIVMVAKSGNKMLPLGWTHSNDDYIYFNIGEGLSNPKGREKLTVSQWSSIVSKYELLTSRFEDYRGIDVLSLRSYVTDQEVTEATQGATTDNNRPDQTHATEEGKITVTVTNSSSYTIALYKSSATHKEPTEAVTTLTSGDEVVVEWTEGDYHDNGLLVGGYRLKAVASNGASFDSSYDTTGYWDITTSMVQSHSFLGGIIDEDGPISNLPKIEDLTPWLVGGAVCVVMLILLVIMIKGD